MTNHAQQNYARVKTIAKMRRSVDELITSLADAGAALTDLYSCEKEKSATIAGRDAWCEQVAQVKARIVNRTRELAVAKRELQARIESRPKVLRGRAAQLVQKASAQ